MTQIIERGNLFFLYRPATGEDAVEGLQDVQRFYMVLEPRDRTRLRLAIIGHKKLPDPDGEERPYWGFIDAVAEGASAFQDTLSGEGAGGPARPAGEGVYAIARHEDHTDIAFALELPEAPGEAQRALNIPEEGRFILTVKNPEASSPPSAGLDAERRAHYPPELQEAFGDERFVPADPPDFLDHAGCEFLLISGAGGLDEIGITLDTHHESPETSDVLEELRLDRERTPLEPLAGGEWR